jgi:hypothetical protein
MISRHRIPTYVMPHGIDFQNADSDERRDSRNRIPERWNTKAIRSRKISLAKTHREIDAPLVADARHAHRSSQTSKCFRSVVGDGDGTRRLRRMRRSHVPALFRRERVPRSPQSGITSRVAELWSRMRRTRERSTSPIQRVVKANNQSHRSTRSEKHHSPIVRREGAYTQSAPQEGVATTMHQQFVIPVGATRASELRCGAADPTQPSDRLPWRMILLAGLGGALELYDFLVFGVFASAIGAAFFPTANPLVSQMLAYAGSAIGYFARPVGGIVLGHFGDRVGRRIVFVSSMLVVSVGTLTMGLLPTYAERGALPRRCCCSRFGWRRGFALAANFRARLPTRSKPCRRARAWSAAWCSLASTRAFYSRHS